MRIEEIKVINGKKLNEKNVEMLMKSIREIGLIVPIFVTEDGTLIAGHHRLEACKRLGMTEIEVIVTSETDEAKLKIMEISENMARNAKFYPAEICKMAWETRKAWIDLGMFNDGHRQKEGENKKTNQDLADLLKVSKSTIKNYLRVWENLTEEAKTTVLENPENYSLKDLMELAKLDPETQNAQAAGYKAEKTSTKGATKKDARDAEIEALRAELERVKAERDEAVRMAMKFKMEAMKNAGNDNAPAGTINKKKMAKLLHPDFYSEALKDRPDLMEKITQAMQIINGL